MEILYNKPIEVTQTQYYEAMNNLQGVVAGRSENGRYYIKCWLMRYEPHIKTLLT